MPEPVKSDPYFTVHAKSPEYEAVAKVFQQVLDHWMNTDEARDMCGFPRVGREPDYINGRWCVRCHNSLPDDWGIKPCDVCGAATGSVSLEGLLANNPRIVGTVIYEGIQRAPKV